VLAAGVVDGPVVYHEPVGVQERPVSDLSHLQVRGIVREHVLRRPTGVRAAELPLVQRRHVPHGDIVTSGLVLLADVAEALEPQPAAVGDVGPALRRGDLVERGPDRVFLRHVVAPPSGLST
jgi:hypothetical protein